ncbi:SIMPL domain-containing protein [Gordonia phthalatica]|uniref:SIMPL domain-containing protein n=1 Tax=Gordonia phthalatica TaxID=1136941 RepID=UPI000783BCF3|nr:SIMPL domain-containing protein [Gordonia phthalatica]
MSPDRTVAVTGSGQASAVPDVMRLQIGVAVVEPNVSTAMERAGASMRAVIDALLAAGVSRPDLATAQLAVHPQYRTGDDPGISGYEVSNMLTAIVRDLDSAGDALAAAAQAGGDDLRVHGVSLTVDDPTAPLAAARDAAFADARRRAEQFAGLAGVRLGPVLSIREGAAGPGPAPRMAAFAASMPVEAGEQQVSAAVDVVFELI